MDFKEIEEHVKTVIDKAKNDDSFKQELKKNPVAAVEDLLGVDLPDEKLKAIAEAVKAKVDLSDIEEKAEGIFEKAKDALEGLLHKD